MMSTGNSVCFDVMLKHTGPQLRPHGVRCAASGTRARTAV